MALAFATVCRADEQAQAREIVEKAIQAMGGAEKLAKQKAVTFKDKGTYYGMGEGLPYTGSYAIQGSDQFKMEIEGVFAIVLNGDKGWVKAADQTMAMTEEQLADQKEELYAGWVTTLLPLKDKAFQLSPLDEVAVDDRAAVGVKVSREGHRDVKLFHRPGVARPRGMQGADMRRTAEWILGLVVLLGGCGGKAGTNAQPAVTPEGGTTASVPLETWDSIYFQGVKVGYTRQRVEAVARDGQRLVRTQSETQMTLRRGPDTTVLELETVSFETLQGRLVRFESVENQAGNRRVVGEADAGGMNLEIHTRDQVEKQRVDWAGEPPEGFWSEYRSLRERPLEPGQTRTLRKFEPYLYRMAEVTLEGMQYEQVVLPEGEARLLRVEYTHSLMPEKSVLWIDAEGEVLKTQAPFEQSVYRTTKEKALAGPEGVAPDLAATSLVPVEGELPRPHQTTLARYRITVQGRDPAELLPSGATQHVRSMGNATIELTVTAIDPASTGDEPAPPDEFREANAILQSDAPRIRALTETAAQGAADPVEVVLRLEKWVHDNLSQKNLKVAFVTAADVAEQLEGDCTEHAVLLAAMARAAGVPSRVVVGLIAVDDGRAFGFHAWTEAFAGGQWLPLDATLGLGRIGAAHIKLADSSMQGADALSLLLPVARVLNRMRIAVVDYRYE